MESNNQTRDVVKEKLYEKQDNFTPAQRDVIKHQLGNLLVSASAGSGKTRVLIEKIVRLIMSGTVKLKNLLVVTFTNSASLELKQRLYASLMESGKEDLISELDNVSTSDILTFDAFCIKILKEFGYTIGYNENFSVADETLSSFFKNQALDSIFQKHNKQIDARFLNFVSQFFEGRNENEVRTSIVKLYNFLMSKSGVSYVSQLNDFYDLKSQNPAIEYANNLIKKLKEHFLNLLNKLKFDSEMLHNEKLVASINEAISLISAIKGDIASEYLYLTQFNLPTISKNTKNDDAETLEIKSQYADLKAEIKKEFASLLPVESNILSLDKMQHDLFQTKDSLMYLFEIIDEFKDEYTHIKKSHKALDFNDIEKLALEIMQNDVIVKSIRDRYTWIFIDEYQDTSPLQEEIVSKITTGDNLFMVGDLKQSIYRFRQAEPQIFISKYDKYKDITSKNNLIELKTNFRSENSILQFNNFVFDKIYKKDIDDFQYKDNSDLEYGGVIKKSTDSPQVNVLIIDDMQCGEDETNNFEDKHGLENKEGKFEGIYSVKNSPLSFGEQKSVEKQALLLAGEIKKMIGKPYYDSNGKKRNVDFKDIAVLTRAKLGVVQQTRKILKEVNIPVTAEFSENIFSCYDMKILIGVLNAIDNQNDDIALLTALVNLGDLTFEELAKIKLAYQDKKFFYEACYCYLDQQSDVISQKLKNCYKKLEFYRNESQYIDVLELVDLIAEKENWKLYFAANNYLEEFESHMQTFADNVQSIKNYDLSEFVNYINTFLINIDQNCVISDGENSITLTTIHKSKGLEYPVVFLIGAEKKFSTSSTKEKILMDNNWGISMSSFDVENHTSYENVIKKIFKHKISDEERKEQKRLLYVALTRAKNYLTIIGSEKSENLRTLKSDYEISKVDNFLEWIIGSLDCDDIKKLCNKREVICDLPQDEKLKVEIISSSELNFDLQPLDDKSLPDNLTIDQKQLMNVLTKKFYHSPLAKKNTVTQIMQEDDHYNISNFKRDKSDLAGEVDFSEIGTVYHKFMQLINFSSNEQDVLKQIGDLVNAQKINLSELKLVDTKKISNAILQINSLIETGDIVSKEKQFLGYFSANEITKSSEEAKLLVQGVADLIIEKENEIYLIDYKTSRLQDELQFSNIYGTQLNLYAKAIESFYKKKVTKKMIYSFHMDKLIII